MKYLILPLLLVLLVSSCKKKIEGCTDSTMYNYDPSANEDNGSCIAVISGCMDNTMFNYNPLANTDDASCSPVVYGCIDADAYNYNSGANTEDSTCINSFIEILTEQGDWIISTSVIDPPIVVGAGEVTDYLTFTENCRKDDLITYDFFSGLGTYTIREGATKCDPNDPNTYEVGDWTINSDSTIFYITPNGDSTQIWARNKISDQEFILEGLGDFQGDGVIRTLTNTFVHQ